MRSTPPPNARGMPEPRSNIQRKSAAPQFDSFYRQQANRRRRRGVAANVEAYTR